MAKRMSLRLPDELHAKLKAAAQRSRRSLHAEILWRLERQPPESRPGRDKNDGGRNDEQLP